MPAVNVWRASSRPESVTITAGAPIPTYPDLSRRDTSTTADELAVWQRAVWQATVWQNATATTTFISGTETNAGPPETYISECPPEIVAVIRDAFAGTGHEDWAVGIAWRESRCQPGATNPNGCCVDSGLFQLRMPIHAHRVAGCDVLDAACNARGARSLFDECGVGPWTPPYSC